MNILFTLEFNVEVGRAAYRSFIKDLRSRLAGGKVVSHGHPVLPDPEDKDTPPTDRFQIVLQTTNTDTTTTPPTTNPKEIVLLFRRHDLYLEAYQMKKSGTWLEFSLPDQTNHLIEGSTLLGFDGGYPGSHGLENTAKSNRGKIRLGRDPLKNAINRLADSEVQQERAESLLVVIQMTAESIRFEEITNFVLSYYDEGKVGEAPGGRILKLENSWGRLSNALLRSDAHPDLSIFPIRYVDQNEQFIITAEQAIAAIGILLFKVEGINLRLAHLNAIDSVEVSEGRPLVEVFAVQINNIDKENPGDLYGRVIVSDGEISQYIYNRERGNIESIKPGESALLTGPGAGAISASDSFTIDVDLMDRDSFPDISPDDEVSKGQIAWNVYHTNNIYDEPLSQEISGEYGSATVVYGVFSDAVQATIEVTLINGDGESPAEVYGLLAASNSKFTGNYESVLFRVTKESDVNVEVKPEELIPLSRSIVAVPLNSDLIVRANLYDRDSALSPDDEIANGTATFPAQASGTLQQNITGKYGEIQVKVTWTP